MSFENLRIPQSLSVSIPIPLALTNKYCLLSQSPLEARNSTKDVTLQQNTETGYQI